jgi:hypothetical protein
MFDYRTLIPPVRRLINDMEEVFMDVKENTERDSLYIKLAEEGYATPEPGGVAVNGVVVAPGGYQVIKNIIKFAFVIPAASEVSIQYKCSEYTDEMICGYIDDSIHTLVEPVLNATFGFNVASGTFEASPYITYDDTYMDQNIQSLFVHGAAMQIMGGKVAGAGNDAIYIRDGDTTIDTASSSRESTRGYDPIVKRYDELMTTVRVNRFSGIVMY